MRKMIEIHGSAVEDGLSSPRLDPAIRIRVLEALKTLNDALDQLTTDHFPAATDNLREAADGSDESGRAAYPGASRPPMYQSGAVLSARKRAPDVERTQEVAP